MKIKIKGMLMIVAMLLMTSCVVAFAADDETTITITNASINESNIVSLECSVENAVDEQEVTIMVVKIENGEFDFNDIVYINQLDYAEGETINFPIDYAPDTSYALRVGGTNIYQSVYAVIVDNEIAVLKGDVNNDGNVDKIDAAIIMKKISTDESIEYSEIIDMNNDGKIDLLDAILILKSSEQEELQD